MKSGPSQFKPQAGLTRPEVAVILLVLAVLGVVLAAYIRLAAGRGKETACAMNVRRLVLAFQSYASAHGRLPAVARSHAEMPEDWVHWQAGRNITQSALATYLGEMSYLNLACPLDEGTRHRQFQFSYTMNTHLHLQPPPANVPPDGLILVFEEERPNDGACLPGHRNDKLAQRHAHMTSQAGYLDGSVRLVHEAKVVPAAAIPP